MVDVRRWSRFRGLSQRLHTLYPGNPLFSPTTTTKKTQKDLMTAGETLPCSVLVDVVTSIYHKSKWAAIQCSPQTSEGSGDGIREGAVSDNFLQILLSCVHREKKNAHLKRPQCCELHKVPLRDADGVYKKKWEDENMTLISRKWLLERNAGRISIKEVIVMIMKGTVWQILRLQREDGTYLPTLLSSGRGFQCGPRWAPEVSRGHWSYWSSGPL